MTGATITPKDVADSVKSEQYFVDGTLTICVLTMLNGYKVVGTSACVVPENFNKQKGQELARKKAEDQIWGLLGYALADKLRG